MHCLQRWLPSLGLSFLPTEDNLTGIIGWVWQGANTRQRAWHEVVGKCHRLAVLASTWKIFTTVIDEEDTQLRSCGEQTGSFLNKLKDKREVKMYQSLVLSTYTKKNRGHLGGMFDKNIFFCFSDSGWSFLYLLQYFHSPILSYVGVSLWWGVTQGIRGKPDSDSGKASKRGVTIFTFLSSFSQIYPSSLLSQLCVLFSYFLKTCQVQLTFFRCMAFHGNMPHL